MGKLMKNALLPLEGIEVMQDELMFVLGGGTFMGDGSGCNCGCDNNSTPGSGSGCNCGCSNSSGNGCDCGCTTTAGD